MTDEPYLGEYRWQGEPQNSPVELWDGKEWVLVSNSVAPSDSAARDLIQRLADAVDSGIPVERIKQSSLMVEVDAYLAQHP